MSTKFAIVLCLAASTFLAIGTSATAVPASPERPPQAIAPGPCCNPAIGTSAAGDVVRAYYRALDAGDYRTAYAKWSNGGAASGLSYGQFVRGFAHTRSTSVDIFNITQPEGGAGSQFVTVAVSVDATLKSGIQQRFVGNYTLRRVNDVPGSTADQRKWHIQSADLRPARR